MRHRPWSIRFADSLATFFGSFWFLVINSFLFVIWIVINSGWTAVFPIFDPYPHVLLITFVSLEAIILTTVVLMSQNRQNHIGTLRDELQLQVELITEREISKVLKLLKKVLEKHDIKVTDAELEEMLEVADISYIERKLEQQILGKTINKP